MDISERVNKIDPILPDDITTRDRLIASMHVWHPELEQSSIPTPETVFVNAEQITINEGTIHQQPWASYDLQEIQQAIKTVNGPPAFIRTDQASDKHGMESSSKLHTTDSDKIESHVSELITRNMNKGMVGLPFSSFAVREWLDIEHQLVGWDNLPIGAEVRAVINEGEIQEIYFYWPKESVEQGLNVSDDPIPNNYEEKYNQTVEIVENNLNTVTPYIKEAATLFERTLGEGWTIDFALTTNMEWYAIDMAPAAMSHIPEEKPLY